MILRIIKKLVSFEKYFNFIFDSFYLSGEPISRHRLHCSLFDVDYYTFTGRFFVHPFMQGWGGLASTRE